MNLAEGGKKIVAYPTILHFSTSRKGLADKGSFSPTRGGSARTSVSKITYGREKLRWARTFKKKNGGC